MTQSINKPDICPLCQRQNVCAVIEGKDLKDCWCNHTTFPPKNVVEEGALEQKACICQSCIAKLKEEADLGLKRVD